MALPDLTTDKRMLEVLTALDKVIADGTSLNTRLTAPDRRQQDPGQRPGPEDRRLQGRQVGGQGAGPLRLPLLPGRTGRRLAAGASPLTNTDLIRRRRRRQVGDVNTVIGGVLARLSAPSSPSRRSGRRRRYLPPTQWDAGDDPRPPAWAPSSPAAPRARATATSRPAAARSPWPTSSTPPLPGIQKAFSAASGGIAAIVAAAGNYRKVHEDSLYENFAATATS